MHFKVQILQKKNNEIVNIQMCHISFDITYVTYIIWHNICHTYACVVYPHMCTHMYMYQWHNVLVLEYLLVDFYHSNRNYHLFIAYYIQKKIYLMDFLWYKIKRSNGKCSLFMSQRFEKNERNKSTKKHRKTDKLLNAKWAKYTQPLKNSTFYEITPERTWTLKINKCQNS